MFFKRLSDQWDYEANETINKLETEHGRAFSEAQRTALLKSDNIHRFKIPDGCHWDDVLAVSQNIGERLTAATKAGIGHANPDLMGVFTVDWNQPAPDGRGTLIPNVVISALIQHFHTLAVLLFHLPA